jgi:hypothetical protein
MGQKTNQKNCRLVNQGFNIYCRENTGCCVRENVGGKELEKKLE